MENLKEVTSDIFYKKIGPLNININCVNPKTGESEYRIGSHGEIVGKTIYVLNENGRISYPSKTRYFLANKKNP